MNAYHLGELFYFLMLSVAYEGELANVDAFDQPGVEAYKKIMKAKFAERSN
jgi:glucose-6-phosphate isomerase